MAVTILLGRGVAVTILLGRGVAVTIIIAREGCGCHYNNC